VALLSVVLFSSSLWKRTHSPFGRRTDIFRLLNLITPGFRFRKSSSPRFLLVGQALRGLLFWFVCIWFICSYYYYYLLFAKLVIVYSVKCCYSTLFIACSILLLLLKGYVKHPGYFGSFLAAYCVHRSTTPFYRVRESVGKIPTYKAHIKSEPSLGWVECDGHPGPHNWGGGGGGDGNKCKWLFYLMFMNIMSQADVYNLE
jgi:hypothetical protein